MIAPELFQLNLVRGRGLFARAVMKAQLASPGFTPVFAALVAVVNTKLPENGELILKRVIVAFRRAYKRRDKVVATALAKFIAHLVNQQVRRSWERAEESVKVRREGTTHGGGRTAGLPNFRHGWTVNQLGLFGLQDNELGRRQ